MDSGSVLNKKNSKKALDRIRSRYILKQILKNLDSQKLLKIFKYNKKIQNILNIDIDDYKKRSIIELQIIPEENKFGKFINISNNKDKPFYHIYFDDNNKEIKKYYIEENENVKKITIKIAYQINSFKELFDKCHCISSIYFKKFYSDNIINMN